MQRLKKKPLFHPLSCWDIASWRKRNFFDILQFKKLVAKYIWHLDENEIERRDFQAIIVTDIQERIIWTSRGFTSMTGYSAEFAVGRRPSFLKGRRTDPVIRQKIRKAIEERKTVSVTLINYRKSGAAYNYQVEIIPLHKHRNQVINFLAIERKVGF